MKRQQFKSLIKEIIKEVIGIKLEEAKKAKPSTNPIDSFDPNNPHDSDFKTHDPSYDKTPDSIESDKVIDFLVSSNPGLSDAEMEEIKELTPEELAEYENSYSYQLWKLIKLGMKVNPGKIDKEYRRLMNAAIKEYNSQLPINTAKNRPDAEKFQISQNKEVEEHNKIAKQNRSGISEEELTRMDALNANIRSYNKTLPPKSPKRQEVPYPEIEIKNIPHPNIDIMRPMDLPYPSQKQKLNAIAREINNKVGEYEKIPIPYPDVEEDPYPNVDPGQLSTMFHGDSPPINQELFPSEDWDATKEKYLGKEMGGLGPTDPTKIDPNLKIQGKTLSRELVRQIKQNAEELKIVDKAARDAESQEAFQDAIRKTKQLMAVQKLLAKKAKAEKEELEKYKSKIGSELNKTEPKLSDVEAERERIIKNAKLKKAEKEKNKK